MMLSQIQKEIVETPGNLIVSASAGTGKTHTLVAKMVHDIEHQHTHKVVAAITFTIKAAKEIKERLAVDTMGHFIGTNNSFAIEEIIKPFMKDVYGMAYRVGMSTDYSVKIHTFEEGIDKIKTKQILCSYQDNKKNFIFELALNILKCSKACQLYLKAKYFKIYVDEYQDCDKDMHNLFMYICDILKIDTFIVGDEKQSIYMWRGALVLCQYLVQPKMKISPLHQLARDSEFLQRALYNRSNSSGERKSQWLCILTVL